MDYERELGHPLIMYPRHFKILHKHCANLAMSVRGCHPYLVYVMHIGYALMQRSLE